MAKRQKMQTVKLPDYGDEEINRLACAQHVLEQMNAEQRLRALKWLKHKFQAEWPSETY